MTPVPDAIWATTSKGTFSLKHINGLFAADGVEVHFVDGIVSLHSEDPVYGIELVFAKGLPDGSMVMGDAWERSYGTLHWSEVDYDRLLPWYFASSHQGKTTCWGVKTGCNSLASWRAGTEMVRLVLDVKSGFRPLRMKKGSMLELATVVTATGGEAFSTLRAFCKTMSPHPRLPKMPIYGANDWYYAYGNNTPERLLEDSKRVSALAESSLNRPYSVIDDGWELTEASDGGPWNRGNKRFPDMPKLAGQILDTGCQPGIWIRPLLSHEKLSPQLFIGSETLDPSLPDALEVVHRNVYRLHEWGYRLIKHDFSTYDVTTLWGFEMTDGLSFKGRTFADDTRTTAQIIKALYETIRDAAGDSVVIGCNTIGHLSAGLFEMQRIGDDTSGKEWGRTVKMGVNTLAFRSVQQGAFFETDPDCVGITTDVPWNHTKLWLDLIARSGTPLIISAQKEAVGPDQERAMREAFKIAADPQQVAEPLDWMETRQPKKWNLLGETKTFDWS